MTYKTLRKGDHGEEVKELQVILNNIGQFGLIPDGVFGSSTDMAVREFQAKHNLTMDGIVGMATWSKLRCNSIVDYIKGAPIKHSKRNIDMIVVHCTATPEGKDYDLDTIRSWHVKQGWSDIGYHYVIHLDGSIELGRDVDKVGAHAVNYNLHSIGIVYVGGCAADGKTPKDTRTPQQKESLFYLLLQLRLDYPHAIICGHRDLAAKACPSFDAQHEYSKL